MSKQVLKLSKCKKFYNRFNKLTKIFKNNNDLLIGNIIEQYNNTMSDEMSNKRLIEEELRKEDLTEEDKKQLKNLLSEELMNEEEFENFTDFTVDYLLKIPTSSKLSIELDSHLSRLLQLSSSEVSTSTIYGNLSSNILDELSEETININSFWENNKIDDIKLKLISNDLKLNYEYSFSSRNLTFRVPYYSTAQFYQGIYNMDNSNVINFGFEKVKKYLLESNILSNEDKDVLKYDTKWENFSEYINYDWHRNDMSYCSERIKEVFITKMIEFLVNKLTILILATKKVGGKNVFFNFIMQIKSLNSPKFNAINYFFDKAVKLVIEKNSNMEINYLYIYSDNDDKTLFLGYDIVKFNNVVNSKLKKYFGTNPIIVTKDNVNKKIDTETESFKIYITNSIRIFNRIKSWNGLSTRYNINYELGKTGDELLFFKNNENIDQGNFSINNYLLNCDVWNENILKTYENSNIEIYDNTNNNLIVKSKENVLKFLSKYPQIRIFLKCKGFL